MIKSTFNDIAITGLACCVPGTEDTLDRYNNIFGPENVEKFMQTTGVIKRRLAGPKQTAADLAFTAAESLLNTHSGGIDPNTIGALLFVTQTPDYRLPSTAYVLQARLGLPQDCICYDLNLGCSGFAYGVDSLAALLYSHNIDRGLLLFGDTVNKFIAPTDRSACMLFGDAGGAALIEKQVGAPPIHTTFRADGNSYRAVVIQSGAYRNIGAPHNADTWFDGCVRSDYDLFMNGTEVFSHMIAEAPKLLKEYLSEYALNLDVYDSLVLHQANVFILKQIAKRIKCPMEKIPISMDRYGNTSVASIPLTIVNTYANTKHTKPLRLLLCGLGGGLSLGVVDCTLNPDDILPVLVSDDYYSNAYIQHN